MHKRTKSVWPFTKKQENIPTSTHSQQQKKEFQASKLYHSINQLPLSKFIELQVDDNLSALIISGLPTLLELQIAKAQIEAEYADAMGDHEHKLYLALYKDITFLSITLSQIEMLIECLHQIYYEPFVKKLNGLLFTNYVFDWSNPDAYHNLLKGCFNRSRGYKLDLDLKIMEFDAIRKKNEGSAPTREYFQRILIIISDHAHYPIQDSVTVFEFCERLKRWNAYCKMMEEQSNKHGRTR
jgi:hypothetical protein